MKIILSYYGYLPNPAQAAWGEHKCSNVPMKCGDCQRDFLRILQCPEKVPNVAFTSCTAMLNRCVKNKVM